MSKYSRMIIILAVLIGLSCKEIYSPTIDESEKMLVVEGLLTDESNVITVKLCNTAPFKDRTNSPEVAARLFVTDDKGRKTPVLGVFEVSSTSMRTCMFSYLLPDKIVKFKEIDKLDIEALPMNGSACTYPSFWIYNYKYCEKNKYNFRY